MTKTFLIRRLIPIKKNLIQTLDESFGLVVEKY